MHRAMPEAVFLFVVDLGSSSLQALNGNNYNSHGKIGRQVAAASCVCKNSPDRRKLITFAKNTGEFHSEGTVAVGSL